MGAYEKEGICVPHSGQEGNSLWFTDGVVITSDGAVLQAAQDDAPREDVYIAFEMEQGGNNEDGYWTEYIASYRKTSGRQYPPVYQVRIRVEASRLSDEDIEKYWKGD